MYDVESYFHIPHQGHFAATAAIQQCSPANVINSAQSFNFNANNYHLLNQLDKSKKFAPDDGNMNVDNQVRTK